MFVVVILLPFLDLECFSYLPHGGNKVNKEAIETSNGFVEGGIDWPRRVGRIGQRCSDQLDVV